MPIVSKTSARDYHLPFLNPPQSYLDEQSQLGVFPYLPGMLEKWLPPPARLLEIGCEGGRGTIPLAEKGYQVTGMDTAPRSLQYAREKVGKKGLSISWVNGDAVEVPVRSETFDGVVLIRQILSLFHGRDIRQKVLAETMRVLKPGGFLFVSIKNGGLDPTLWHVLHYLYCRAFVYPLPTINREKLKEVRIRLKQLWNSKRYLAKQNGPGPTRDVYITTMVSQEMCSNVPYHIYHIDELKEDLQQVGFSIRDCRDYLEVEQKAKLPAFLRRGSPFLILACQKV